MAAKKLVKLYVFLCMCFPHLGDMVPLVAVVDLATVSTIADHDSFRESGLLNEMSFDIQLVLLLST